MNYLCFLSQYPNKNVALVASDILHLLISYVDHLQKFPPDTPKKIVEVRHILLYTSKQIMEYYTGLVYYLSGLH